VNARIRTWLGLVLALASASVLAQQPSAQASGHRTQRLHERGVAVPEGVRVPAWKELNPRQRTDLASFADRWDRLPASRRVQILERYSRFQSLPPEKQNALREGAVNFQQMTPQQRQKMRESVRVLRTLPPEEQRALRKQWEAMTPEQRRAWLDEGGPGVTAAPKP
jgi:Protein of unknown function (DUF3106)